MNRWQAAVMRNFSASDGVLAGIRQGRRWRRRPQSSSRVDALGGVVGEAGEDIGEPRARVDVVELAGLCRPANYAERVRFPQDSPPPGYDQLGIVRSVPPLSTAEIT